ncbi:acyl-CoA N-acyltransferase [Coniophora puteana RWD-64-598 SS2]|uniref:histone acetyltransferase n=1 Tax=Coniophora puteana (strain RWD-64-598) TaxID=741705 RepID=A0A5M3N4P0_CONPW|nr:acyl-CoA N-acyltransferase [Coniophora puteana RWD-64-598 SS2]EIW86217.1 acyl-CoA N-acyltransferase [Coniophora puteana RWD-64-598 SS2]
MTSSNQVLYAVERNGISQLAQVLQRRPDGQVYVHYEGADKRMDEWLPGEDLQLVDPDTLPESQTRARKRKRQSSHVDLRQNPPILEEPLSSNVGPSTMEYVSESLEDISEAVMEGTKSLADSGLTEEEFDLQHHKQITAKRNFDKVNFAGYQIKTWYFSPYPLTDSELEDPAQLNPLTTTSYPRRPSATSSSTNPSKSSQSSPDPTVPIKAPTKGLAAAGKSVVGSKIPGVPRTSVRTHGRTSDLFAGGLTRSHLQGENSLLWVCDRCFKYMSDGGSWELHAKRCDKRHPPGEKVYQRGAHIIWEVDGAKEKLYCQNLALFGKLFIDVKTIFFDCDNFLFYILTDADSQRDHVIGFFSKEKVSYDDYNLACIVVLPPYQRKGYGMLLIEFSYELSRRAGKVGTPERPLSDLGLRSYLTYWVGTLIRFFRRLLNILPPDIQVNSIGGLPNLNSFATVTPNGERKKKQLKGWAGEIDGTSTTGWWSDETINSLRTIESTPNLDGSVTSHVVVRCTLEEISRATNMRVEDCAFALNECGLLVRRRVTTASVIRDSEPASARPTPSQVDGETEEVGTLRNEEQLMVVITREAVEAVAAEKKVKPICMLSPAHVLL